MDDKKTIMIIDDDTDFLIQFQEMLNLSGYKTVIFSDGDTAIKSIVNAKPDVVLLDLKMEGMSGFDVARELKADPKTSSIPIIAMSAFYMTNGGGKKIEDLGAVKCLHKPLKPLEVINEIEEVVA